MVRGVHEPFALRKSLKNFKKQILNYTVIQINVFLIFTKKLKSQQLKFMVKLYV
jgi:hypothetical protein